MYITLETDYAIRISDCLARKGERMSAQSVAEACGVTLRFSLKILSKLAASGIVRSYKGSHGGYEIGRDLSEISVNDILVAIEGPYMFSRCLAADHNCSRNEGGSCPYHKLFEGLSDNMREQLQEATLAQIISRS